MIVLHLLSSALFSVNTLFVTLFLTTVERASCEVYIIKYTLVVLQWLASHRLNICSSRSGGLACVLGRASHRYLVPNKRVMLPRVKVQQTCGASTC